MFLQIFTVFSKSASVWNVSKSLTLFLCMKRESISYVVNVNESLRMNVRFEDERTMQEYSL